MRKLKQKYTLKSPKIQSKFDSKIDSETRCENLTRNLKRESNAKMQPEKPKIQSKFGPKIELERPLNQDRKSAIFRWPDTRQPAPLAFPFSTLEF